MNDQRLSADRIASLLDQMKGLTVALATPLNERDELDAAGLERLLERVIAGGASCLFPAGLDGRATPLVQQRPQRDAGRDLPNR